MQTIVTGYTEAYVDTHPYYRSTFIPARTVARTATGSGVGAQVAGVSGSNQLRLGTHTDYSFPYLTGGRYYLGAPVFKRTADGSGVGTQTAVRLIITLRTATGSGAAGESASTIKEVLARTATGSGVGSGEADPFLIVARPATGSGVGTSSTTFIRGLPRVATGSGTGTQAAVRLVINIRTATGSGVGTQNATKRIVWLRTASGSGVGAVSQNATWVKSRMFRVPQTTSFAFVEAYSETTWQPRQRLFARLPNGTRVENLFELQDGSYTINDPRDGTVVRVYLGSHVIPLTDEEVADLTAAGYGAYIT